MRLIDADNIREKIERWLASCEAWREETRNNNALSHCCARQAVYTLSDVEQALDGTPTVDAVPVVRCKDCRFCDKEDEWTMWCMSASPACLTTPEDYCSHGKRKENQE